jgi:hypothetical protein
MLSTILDRMDTQDELIRRQSKSFEAQQKLITLQQDAIVQFARQLDALKDPSQRTSYEPPSVQRTSYVPPTRITPPRRTPTVPIDSPPYSIPLPPVSPPRSPTLGSAFEDPFRPKRRATVFESISKSTIPNMINPQLQRTLPSYAHIKLNNLNLEEAMQFMDQIYEYESENKVILPINTLVSRNVRNMIMAELDVTLTDREFFTLKRAMIFFAIHAQVRPTSKPAFARALTKKIDIDWPPNFELEAKNFKVAYERFLIFRVKWLKRYDFMALENEDNIPECRDNEEGLIGIFLKGMSNYDQVKGVNNYVRNLYGRLPYDKKKKFRERNGFDLFIDCLYSYLYQDYTKFKHTRELGESIRPFKNEKLNNIPNRKPTEAWTKTPIKRPDQQKNSNNTYYNKKVNALEMEHVVEYAEEDEHDNIDSPEIFPPQQSEYDAQSFNSQDDNLKQAAAPDTDLHAMAAKPAANSKPNTDGNVCCFSKLFRNECTRPKCTYSHAPADLAKGYLFYAEQLSKSPHKPPGVTITLPRETIKTSQESARHLLRLLTKTDDNDEGDY